MKLEEERKRILIRNNIEENKRVNYSQFGEIVPQDVRQEAAIISQRESQTVALGQTCEALISNQNFLLQNSFGKQSPIQHPAPPECDQDLCRA